MIPEPVNATENISEVAQVVGHRVGDMADSLGAAVNRAWDERMGNVAQEQATDFQQMIIDEVLERPVRALGFAAAIGLIAGFIVAR
ncbi:hypothetical protein [Bosea sp. BIWAKO-01]|uniref:hypothetical protein n=1 Tax=Bosea sp. BIWAKO-01 TaxID=506668 RepID=UPI000852B2C5|nr:hypothetical protein [Bosea sp. BIWAKO-01]